MGVGSLKKEDYQIGSTLGAIGPNCSSAHVQHNKDNLDSETEESGQPEEYTFLKRP